MSKKVLGKRSYLSEDQKLGFSKRLRLDRYSQVVPNCQVPEELLNTNIPKYGALVERNKVRRAGEYIIGHEIGNSPVPVTQYLARKENTNDFYMLKILSFEKTNENVNKESLQGKMLIHTEYSLLSLLHDLEGVIHHHGLFSDYAFEEKLIEKEDKTQGLIYTGRVKKRIILVLDCVCSHEFSEKSSEYINLQKYISLHKFTETDAVLLFYEIVKVVESLHDRNIIHRDLKLNNIVLNRRSNKIIITNFFLGKHLNREDDSLYDQRGSPAYISPDVLGGKPYKGKPSDIWALGVVLYTILYGKFPFVDTTPSALFKKIRQADFIIPVDQKTSDRTNKLIKLMLTLNPEERLTATEVRYQVEKIIDKIRGPKIEFDQVVPEISDNGYEEDNNDKNGFKKTYPKYEFSHEPFSQILETLPQKRENENFIKPRLLSIQRVGSNLRPIIQSTFSRSSIINNHVFGWGLRNRQSSHLRRQDLRSRHSNANNQDLYEIRIAPSNELERSGERSTNETTRAANPILLQVDAQSIQQMMDINPSNQVQNQSVQNLYSAVNEMFVRGRIPVLNRDACIEFNGIITNDIANKIVAWLLINFRNYEIIREIFGNSQGNKVNNLLEMLRRFGVEMETINGVITIKKEQPLDILMFMTYLLQIAGCNNNYFVTIRL